MEKTNKKRARRFKITGIVQGVGFRPFVWRTANNHDVKGRVANTSSGVDIHAEASALNLSLFEKEIRLFSPPLSVISEIISEDVSPEYCVDFVISESRNDDKNRIMISPDVSVCENCIKEMNDRKDRRYKYPFINCTDCGPRYSIITGTPYDREKTSMKDFRLCFSCMNEYNDPKSRRFHAQPNACENCGPTLNLMDEKGVEVKCDNPVNLASRLLKDGYCVAVKSLGGFHLAVDAQNSEAVKDLRREKKRGDKPFAVMAATLDIAKKIAEISPEEEEVLTSFQKPVLLLKKKKDPELSISADIAPSNRYIGIMLPYAPLHFLLHINELPVIVMTSANRKNEPVVTDNDSAIKTLKGLAGYFLVNNREIYMRSDDSVLRVIRSRPYFIRRSRGFVPLPLFFQKSFKKVLALGGTLKSTVCFLEDNRAVISQHIGDIDNLSTFKFFENTINHMIDLFDFRPEIIAHDLHPDYPSTRYAKKKGTKRVAVQHHHAHLAACMADNSIEDPVIGIVFDGTGYGDDGKIWGGEVMIADFKSYKRRAHVGYFALPGGEAAIREPWRTGLSLLYRAYGRKIPIMSERDSYYEKAKMLIQMIEKKVNSPETSSMGRLFDGISSILGIRNIISYEGEAAIALEMTATDDDSVSGYDIKTGEFDSDGIMRIDTSAIIKAVVSDITAGTDVALISRRFHQTIVDIFSEVCCILRNETEINNIALSGGVFQNRILLDGFLKKLGEEGFEVWHHNKSPCNDGGLSLGQSLIASEI